MAIADVIRRTTPADVEALRRFRCSTGSWFEDDVERLIRGRFADRVGAGFTAWIVEKGGEIFAVASHEAQSHPGDPAQTITFLNVLACRADERDAWLVGAARLARLVRPMFAEVFASDRAPCCYTRIAVDNHRMRAFCERSGFTSGPIPSDPRYLFYTLLLRGPAVSSTAGVDATGTVR